MGFTSGLECLRRGFELIGRRELRRYVWAPVGISLTLITLLLGAAFSYVPDAVVWTMGFVPDALGFVEWIIAPAVYFFVTLVGVWLLGFLAVLVASPFLGFLAVAAERTAIGAAPDFDEGFWAALAHAFGRELRKLGYHLPRLAALFVVSLFPLFSPFAPFAWLVFGGWMVAVEFADFAAEGRGLPFTDTPARLKRRRAAALGFGIPASLLLAIPLVNVIAIPAAVCGGVLLWHRCPGKP